MTAAAITVGVGHLGFAMHTFRNVTAPLVGFTYLSAGRFDVVQPLCTQSHFQGQKSLEAAPQWGQQ